MNNLGLLMQMSKRKQNRPGAGGEDGSDNLISDILPHLPTSKDVIRSVLPQNIAGVALSDLGTPFSYVPGDVGQESHFDEAKKNIGDIGGVELFNQEPNWFKSAMQKYGASNPLFVDELRGRDYLNRVSTGLPDRLNGGKEFKKTGKNTLEVSPDTALGKNIGERLKNILSKDFWNEYNATDKNKSEARENRSNFPYFGNRVINFKKTGSYEDPTEGYTIKGEGSNIWDFWHNRSKLLQGDVKNNIVRALMDAELDKQAINFKGTFSPTFYDPKTNKQYKIHKQSANVRETIPGSRITSLSGETSEEGVTADYKPRTNVEDIEKKKQDIEDAREKIWSIADIYKNLASRKNR